MQRALLLDVVVTQGAAVLELLAGKDEALLVGRDALLALGEARRKRSKEGGEGGGGKQVSGSVGAPAE